MKWRINNYSTNYEQIDGKFDVNLYIPPTSPSVITASNPDCYGYLFITLKMYFERDNTGSGVDMNDDNKSKFKTVPWPDSEWVTFQNKIKELSHFWDMRFWLVLQSDKKFSSEYKRVEKYLSIYQEYDAHKVSGQRQQVITPRTISCRFSLQALDNPAGAHKQVKVAYLVNKADNSPVQGVNATYISRSNAVYYDSGDVIADAGGQVAIIHELGHAIGLPHIGKVTNYAACLVHKETGGGNSGDCYDGPLSRDIMGRGAELNWQDATPWRFALQEMTKVPLTHYIVQQTPFVNTSGELITQGTSRWNEFYD